MRLSNAIGNNWNYFVRKIEITDPGVEVMPVLIDTLDSETEYKKVLEADLIVTTFFHFRRSRNKLPQREEDILGIMALDPVHGVYGQDKPTAHGAKVLLVCISESICGKGPEIH